MPSTVYLVSGANRGIGLAIVTALASRDNTIVFAGARNPSAATDLHALVEKYPGKFHVVKLVSNDKAGNEVAAAQIKEIAGRLDVVIANAAISQYYGSVLETPTEQLNEHFDVNVGGTLVLFQAVYPLLAENAGSKFVAISSGAGSLADGAVLPMKFFAYGVSKAGVNYLLRRIHVEHPELVAFAISPGMVATDMGKFATTQDEMAKKAEGRLITAEDSARGVLKVVDGSTRENEGGKLMDHTGTVWNF